MKRNMPQLFHRLSTSFDSCRNTKYINLTYKIWLNNYF